MVCEIHLNKAIINSTFVLEMWEKFQHCLLDSFRELLILLGVTMVSYPRTGFTSPCLL